MGTLLSFVPHWHQFALDPSEDILVFFFEIHFRAPWGTEPYVALHYEYLYVTDASVSVFSLLPFPLKPPHFRKEVALRYAKCRVFGSAIFSLYFNGIG